MSQVHVPAVFRPGDDEAAVLSAVAFRDGEEWVIASGSLVTTPTSVAYTSWRRWSELQPRAWTERAEKGFDLGPIFEVEPFPGVLIARQVLSAENWDEAIARLDRGELTLGHLPTRVRVSSWSSTVHIGIDCGTTASNVVVGARRPVLGVAAFLDPPTQPESEGIWTLQSPTYLEPGPDLGRIAPWRSLPNWPTPLVGINWPGSSKVQPPAAFLIGRSQSRAWIARVQPDFQAEELKVHIGWDETAVDPLSCTLVTRQELDGLCLSTRSARISDYPHGGTISSPEPRTTSWRERLMTITVPRGARRTDWGIQLLGPDGRIIDERPVATRVEQIKVGMKVGGEASAAHEFSVGDPKPPPTAAERDIALVEAANAEIDALAAAARRRLSTAGELETYLRWRFSNRAGELQIIDAHLLGAIADRPRVFAVLDAMNRPIRALVRAVDADAQTWLATRPTMDFRLLPNGPKTVHDRIWIVGETALLVGGSANTFVPAAGSPSPATTVADLPYADALEWKARFDTWWPATKPPVAPALPPATVTTPTATIATPARTGGPLKGWLGRLSAVSARIVAAVKSRRA
jgi:hypothetical protein